MALFEKKLFRDLGFRITSKTIYQVYFGLIIPLIIMFIIGVIFHISGIGYFTFEFSQERLLNVFYSIPYYILIGFNEELLFRGFIFQRMIDGFGKVFSITFLSLLFGIAHYFNPFANHIGIANVVLAGLLFSLLFVFTKSLWLPIVFHFSWNFTEGMLFGFPVSGVKSFDSIVIFNYKNYEILSGGNFGPEGSILLSFLLVLVILFVIKKRNNLQCEE